MVTSKNGFSLVEFMIYSVIVAFLIVGVFTMYKKIQTTMKSSQADTEIGMLKANIENYKARMGKYPSSLDDLVKIPSDPALRDKYPTGGFLPGEKEAPKDPWGNEYRYKNLGKTFMLESTAGQEE
ncbi:MAG: General secretion pathway protein G [candidate division TM6 bacterium GW2011_GWF2_32_72]|nr:MAG: General secretion pathway protein G [candidate division TM6 bacterium GW2011_GWF2_32_72]